MPENIAQMFSILQASSLLTEFQSITLLGIRVTLKKTIQTFRIYLQINEKHETHKISLV